MYRLLLCDDKVKCRRFIKSEVKIFFSHLNEEYELYEYTSGDQVLFHLKPGFFDIGFFDVEMPGTNGIETAQTIRGMDRNLIIIFTSAHEERVFSSFIAEPFTFLTKPLTHKEFQDALSRALKQVNSSRSKKFIYENNKSTRVIPLRDIMFFESTGRKVEIVTMNDRFSFYNKLDEVQENPELQNFLRSHKSYLINPDYILEISGTSILLTNHKSLPVSRGAYKQIKEKFFFSYLSELDSQL